MHDPAREALTLVLTQYGVSIVDTPRSLATMLKQHAKTTPQDVDALMDAITHGVVQLIRDDPQHDPESLARVLVMHGAVSDAKAAWAVSTWTEALARSAVPAAPSGGLSSPVRTTAMFVAAAAIGVVAYLFWRR